MGQENNPTSPGWNEENTETFLDRGKYFVFEREYQMDTLLRLIPDPGRPFRILELCCGEGLLAERALARFPRASVRGLDGSKGMLDAARLRLSPAGERFSCTQFDLAEDRWRKTEPAAWAVLSSLAIHHLDGADKARLFRDVHSLVEPGGVFLISDLVLPAGPNGLSYAAWAYDEAVRQRALELDGNEHAFEAFKRLEWNYFHYPDDSIDHPSALPDQLRWLSEAGFGEVDVYWVRGGHAIFGGRKING